MNEQKAARILIAEDGNPRAKELSGWVIVCKHPTAKPPCASRENVDVLLCDINMPRDGM